MIGHLGTRVSALLDGQLTPAEAERAWEHVHACHACRDLVEREGWVKTQLAALSGTGGTPDRLKGELAHGVVPRRATAAHRRARSAPLARRRRLPGRYGARRSRRRRARPRRRPGRSARRSPAARDQPDPAERDAHLGARRPPPVDPARAGWHRRGQDSSVTDQHGDRSEPPETSPVADDAATTEPIGGLRFRRPEPGAWTPPNAPPHAAAAAARSAAARSAAARSAAARSAAARSAVPRAGCAAAAPVRAAAPAGTAAGVRTLERADAWLRARADPRPRPPRPVPAEPERPGLRLGLAARRGARARRRPAGWGPRWRCLRAVERLERRPGRQRPRPGRRVHPRGGAAPRRERVCRRRRSGAAAQHRPGRRRSSRASPAGPPVRGSSSTPRGTSSPTTTSSPARPRTDGPIEVVDTDGNRYSAELVGRSPVYDLAVLYVEDATDLRPAALGASSALNIGEAVVAIGSPLGPELHGHRRHRVGARTGPSPPATRPTTPPTSTPSRPTRPSTPATPAARWSTSRARSSGSTPRSPRPEVGSAASRATSVSASPSRSSRCGSRPTRSCAPARRATP